MWIFLRDAFFSIVTTNNPRQRDKLLVRSRFKGDIERHFPGHTVSTTLDRDYRFRAIVPRREVADVLAAEVQGMTAPNFKDSVGEDWRHDVYLRVWTVMNHAQEKRHGKRQRGRQGNLPLQGV